MSDSNFSLDFNNDSVKDCADQKTTEQILCQATDSFNPNLTLQENRKFYPPTCVDMPEFASIKTGDASNPIKISKEINSDDATCSTQKIDAIHSVLNFNCDFISIHQSDEPIRSLESSDVTKVSSTELDFNDVPADSQTNTQLCNDDSKITQSRQDSLHEADCRMQKSGLIRPKGGFISDGKIHRCGTYGKEKGKDGAYAIHILPFCVIALWWNWRTTGDKTQKYISRFHKHISQDEKAAIDSLMDETPNKMKEDRQKLQDIAIRLVRKRWDSCSPAPENHPYGVAKKIKPHGIRYDPKRNRLVIPIYNKDGEIINLQYISPNGDKRFMTHCPTDGGHFIIPASPGQENDPILICEGYATGASLHEATGYEVWVAFSAYNLKAVAQIVSSRYCFCGLTLSDSAE